MESRQTLVEIWQQQGFDVLRDLLWSKHSNKTGQTKRECLRERLFKYEARSCRRPRKGLACNFFICLVKKKVCLPLCLLNYFPYSHPWSRHVLFYWTAQIIGRSLKGWASIGTHSVIKTCVSMCVCVRPATGHSFWARNLIFWHNTPWDMRKKRNFLFFEILILALFQQFSSIGNRFYFQDF